MSARQIVGVLGGAAVLAAALLLATPAVFHAAPPSSDYHLIRNVLLGGEGGWDYITVDPAAKRVYIPRSEAIALCAENASVDAIIPKLSASVRSFIFDLS